MIFVQAAKHEAGTSATQASSASKASGRDFILGWLKDANKTQYFFLQKWHHPFKRNMFQLVSFLKLRHCMTVILPFCVQAQIMQSQPKVKGATPKSSSVTQSVLMRGLIFFHNTLQPTLFCQEKNQPRRNPGEG